MTATGTRSNVTPVVLREDTRPPAYGDKYSGGAPRPFYSRYSEYKKRIEHANAGGAIQREVVSMAEQIPSHVRKVFARVYHASRTITPTQLEVAVESHAGHGEDAGMDHLQRPRPWRAGGAVSSSAGRAGMARNRQFPRRSGSAIGVAS